HYENMYFNRMAKYWESQSSGRYSVEGEVTEWVKVPFNEARYGRDVCGGITCSNTWFLIRDALAYWVQDQMAAGMTMAQISDYLKTFDVQDRYDFDGDGNFDEPDGYIDHFQIVHAGGDQAAGDPQQGSDAIWSHRWYAQINPFGSTGPAGLLQGGGVEIGQGGVSDPNGANVTIPSNPTGVWVGDYTIQPENGGLGVFAHEFGHDLGLPDLYDTSGNTGGAENSTGFWTLYSSGSYGNHRGTDGIGDDPTDLGAFEKFQLGWLGCPSCPGGPFYQVVRHGENASIKLGPANSATKGTPQAFFVLLPDNRVDNNIGAPFAGSKFYYSGSGNDLDNVMYKQVTLPANATLTAKVRYEIEEGWDYAYVVVSTDNGATWKTVPTNLSAADDPNGQNFGNGITGSSAGAWVDLTANLSGYSGNVLLGFRYWTDGAVAPAGFGVDEIAITGLPTDGAEADAGWTYAGFIRTTGTITQSFFNAYFGEFRQYTGYDESLKTGPYNFGFLDNPNLQNWVEHYPYQDGLLVWYYDTSFADNNVGDYCAAGRCGGLFLPVDAHPGLLIRPDNGKVWRPRIQSYDATFGLEATDKITLHANSIAATYGGLPAVPVFDDTKSYWVAPNPAIGHFGWSSVPVPHTGTSIRVVSTSSQDGFMQVEVRTAK
ncbi:peptidase M6, partial [Kouleothrix aurantiaca]